MEQPEWDRQNKAARTELPEQDCQHRAAKIRQPGQDKKERTSEKHSQYSTARTASRNNSARTEKPGQGKQTGQQNRTASTVLLGQDI
jgi:hypothetical protein